MNKISVNSPRDKAEHTAAAAAFMDRVDNIAALKSLPAETRELKRSLMQAAGHIRSPFGTMA